jgi:ribosomal protein S18 acetylase RimI-like enzyme
MTTTAIEPVRLERAQLDDAGAVLGRAFHTNPGFMWMLPDEASRFKKLSWFMRAGASVGHKDGEVYTPAGTVEGAAVWLPPRKTTLTMRQMVAAGLLAAPLRWGMGPLMRFMSVTQKMEHLHKRAMGGEDHWYLMILGVDPPRQGQGVGSALIAPVLQKADASRLPCYLETDKPEDIKFYEKHGFELGEKFTVKDSPPFWTMRRRPRG